MDRYERLLDSRIGWIVPFGAPYKIGRRDSDNRTLGGSWLIWGVYGERMYERGRQRSIAEVGLQ